MSRECRRVAPGYVHPMERHQYRGQVLRPLFEGKDFAPRYEAWKVAAEKWDAGLVQNWTTYPVESWRPRTPDDGATFEENYGAKPDPDNFMPNWPAEVATHFMMFETVSEGTPLSPACETPDACARYCADHDVDGFGVSYAAWLRVCLGGYAPSFVAVDGVLMDGTEGAHRLDQLQHHRNQLPEGNHDE